LESIDSKQFVKTPLHIAVSRGHLRFAAEIMNLKPSFALKLNQQGFSPIHLAIQNNQKRIVFLLVDMNRELVRVKGREGWTSFHFASHMEDVELLAKFLFVCPESIENVTEEREWAAYCYKK
jgi:ankyrin repeat protein